MQRRRQPSLSKKVWSPDEVRGLGVTTDIPTACSIVFGVGRSRAWEMYHNREREPLPFPVLAYGRQVRVPVSVLLRLLELPESESESDSDAA